MKHQKAVKLDKSFNNAEIRGSSMPRTHSVEGIAVEFNRREAPDVDITVPDHLLCVNFNTITNAVYAYSGASERRGTRKVGYAHLINANHTIKGYTPSPTNHVVFTINPARLRRLAQTTFDSDCFDLQTNGIPFFDPFIYQIGRSMRDELCAENPGGAMMLDSLATMLSIHLLRKHSNLKQRPGEQRLFLAPHKLALVSDYIDEYFSHDITLNELANLVDMSPFHFGRCFKEATGQSPLQYIINKRIEFLQRELINDKLPLAELSLAAGFSSQSHMSKAFKKHVGVAPGAFRKNAQ